jgi:hypothetical protein
MEFPKQLIHASTARCGMRLQRPWPGNGQKERQITGILNLSCAALMLRNFLGNAGNKGPLLLGKRDFNGVGENIGVAKRHLAIWPIVFHKLNGKYAWVNVCNDALVDNRLMPALVGFEYHSTSNSAFNIFLYMEHIVFIKHIGHLARIYESSAHRTIAYKIMQLLHVTEGRSIHIIVSIP